MKYRIHSKIIFIVTLLQSIFAIFFRKHTEMNQNTLTNLLGLLACTMKLKWQTRGDITETRACSLTCCVSQNSRERRPWPFLPRFAITENSLRNVARRHALNRKSSHDHSQTTWTTYKINNHPLCHIVVAIRPQFVGDSRVLTHLASLKYCFYSLGR